MFSLSSHTLTHTHMYLCVCLHTFATPFYFFHYKFRFYLWTTKSCFLIYFAIVLSKYHPAVAHTPCIYLFSYLLWARESECFVLGSLAERDTSEENGIPLRKKEETGELLQHQSPRRMSGERFSADARNGRTRGPVLPLLLLPLRHTMQEVATPSC